jgi:hypothetical protein
LQYKETFWEGERCLCYDRGVLRVYGDEERDGGEIFGVRGEGPSIISF